MIPAPQPASPSGRSGVSWLEQAPSPAKGPHPAPPQSWTRPFSQDLSTSGLSPMSLCLLICKMGITTTPFSSVCVSVTQLCLTLCDCMDCSPPGSSVHGILQARILAWVAVSFSRDRTQVSHIAGRFFTV